MDMHPNDPAPETLARYLAGEASGAERAAVEQWAARHETNRAELDRLAEVWAARPQGQWDVDHAWAKVSARIDQGAGAQHEAPEPAPRRAGKGGLPVHPSTRLPVLLAAALVIAIGAMLLFRSISPAPALPELIVTAPGERHDLELADGTRVTLAPGSSLQVAAGYGDSERRVDLVGEAWFQVVHDERSPFRVYASGTITEDLGTTFSVRALRGSNVVLVALVEGAASLRAESGPAALAVPLSPNDVGILRQGEAVATLTHDVAVQALVGWHQGMLEFADARLDSVATELSRWYGVSFRVQDSSLGARRLTATLRLDALDDALDVLRLSLGAEVTRQNGTVVLR